jgi:predicted RNA-binding protein with PUA-like domain
MKNINYWLLKSEPEVYSLQDLQKEGQTLWDGVRNYQARNFLQQMKRGDLAFFYHSNTAPPGIVGLMRVVETGVIDPTQFDPLSPYYDGKSSPDSPRWLTVRVEFERLFDRCLPLATLKQTFSADELLLVRTGNRLSVMPVQEAIAETILSMVDNEISLEGA